MITIETDNAAFEGRLAYRREVTRILRALASRIADTPGTDLDLTLRDVNGNTVGHCRTTNPTEAAS